MDVLKDARAKKYISLLDGTSPSYNVLNGCRCLVKNMPEGVHSEIATPFNSNSAEICIMRKGENIGEILLYITKKSYFDGDTMKLLVREMLNATDNCLTNEFYRILHTNFLMHPPCAQYMSKVYDDFILVPSKNYFSGMPLWDYLVDCLNRMVNAIFFYENKEATVYAIKKTLIFCVEILQMDFEVSKIKNVPKPLVMKCFKYHPEKKTKMLKIMKILNQLFKTRQDFQMPVIHLVMLVNQFH